jgi:hypothetical protein
MGVFPREPFLSDPFDDRDRRLGGFFHRLWIQPCAALTLALLANIFGLHIENAPTPGGDPAPPGVFLSPALNFIA